MLRALGWLLAVLVLAAGGWWLYAHTGSRAVSTSGNVFPRDLSADPPDTKDDADSTAPANPAPANATPANATSATVIPAPAPGDGPTASLPVSDSIPRNPPAGMAFGGGGKYQWYRQGDITWRIDTISGAACIDFATMDQWARAIVYSHGCRRS